MQPIAATVAAVEELGPFAHDGDLLEDLIDLGVLVSRACPDAVAMSIIAPFYGSTLTLLRDGGSPDIAADDMLPHIGASLELPVEFGGGASILVVYGSDVDALADERAAALVGAVGGDRGKVARDTDLRFATLLAAEATPGRLRGEATPEGSEAWLGEVVGQPGPVADDMLRRAACRAGIAPEQLGEALLYLVRLDAARRPEE